MVRIHDCGHLAGAVIAVLFALSPELLAVQVLPEEQAEARLWWEAKLNGDVPRAVGEVGLVVLANHDPVQKNGRGGKPMRIVDRSYTRGLYCHAFSRIIVRLPGPGGEFTAIIGVDTNDQTSGGRGSVDFSVHVMGEEKFRSGVIREGMTGSNVKVDLGGASELVLQVDETPDGIACDQADWAEAKVRLTDGRELWLSDLPLREGEHVSYSADPPFSFCLNGEPSAEFLGDWKHERSTVQLDAKKLEQTRAWTDAVTGLQLRWVATRYADFPTVEWTLHLTNAGTNDSPLIADFFALDTLFAKHGSGDLVLHHHKGTFVRADDFEPLTTTLQPGSMVRFAPPGGRPLGHVFPYFNVEQQPEEGVIAVVGWPGQWFAEFTTEKDKGLRIVAGQEKVRLRLRPGESIRSPLIVLQFWRGDWIHAQNVWRRWMVAHNVPRPVGRPLVPQMAACSSHQFGEMIQANEANQIMFVDRYLEERLPLDYWWMDAGWYVMDSQHHPWGWPCTGTWEVDTKRFPRGLRAITDHAHAKGVKSIVWFEPERVAQGTWLYTNNPAWLLGKDGSQKLLNLGHAEAREWATGHFSEIIAEEGIDLYRQDYNIDPLGYWRAADETEREGITENHYVAGYLAYWDALRARFPNLVIDTCASGGHRNDLETLRRAVPLLRSDYIMEPVGQQCHTYGLAFWIPFFGTGTSAMDPYHFRSQMCPHFTACFDMRRNDLPFSEVRRLLAQWKKEVAPHYFGDFYPLTPYTTGAGAWLAWQFDSPDEGAGVVQAFRRDQSFYESARLKLHGLDPNARYLVTDLDKPEGQEEYRGADLMEQGLVFTAPAQPAAMVVVYRRKLN